jgi:hypothetical protein
MNSSVWRSIAFSSLLVWPLSSFSAADSQPLLNTVKAFYGWVLKNGEAASRLEPKIVNVSGSTRFFLDTSSLQAFTEKFMNSQLFSPQFPNAVAKYYTKYQKEFEALTQKDFDDLARDGRGPLMDVEDMDIYFCAQEYEYTPKFVDSLKISKSTVNGNTATAVIESPYEWKTTFHFTKVKGKWLISGYCVYQ